MSTCWGLHFSLAGPGGQVSKIPRMKKKKALRQPRIRTCPDNKAGTAEGVSAADQNVVSTEAAGKAMSLFPASSGKALLIGSLLLLFVFYCSVALRYGGFAGWRDDSIYLCTAKSLAEGRGFRHMETPGSPFETKYPPLYPATLALVFMLGGEFPKNMPLFFLPGAFALIWL